MIVSISLKCIMSSFTISDLPSGNQDTLTINTYSQIDSLLVFNNDSFFGRIYHQNWHQQLNFFLDADFTDSSMKYYAFGNLYYNLWREAIAARNLLLEIQHSLFLEPAIDRFFPQIPIPKDVLLDEYYLKPGHLAVIKKQYNNYKNKFHTYDMGLSGSGGENIFLFDNLANTKYFDSLAHKYFEETTNQLASFIDLEDSLFTGSLKSRVRLAFLYAIKKEKGKIGNIIPPALFNVIIDSLYADNYALKIEVIELLPYLENIGFINQENIAEIHSSLNFELAKALLQSKREIMGLEKIDGLPIINQETIQKEKVGDMIYYPEYIITKSEIYLMNNDIKKAEEIINYLWFKDSSPNPPPYSWWFNNYPEYLLKTIRLGYWDGARLPHYIGEIFDLYSENKDFKGIRDTLSLLVTRVTRHVGKSTAYN